jgi:acyl transferase domain-containing protein/NAD(P)H-dependent flavin oxidoreductase YrpB (nitropropane dioxygenase family)/NAD(P)-dependent dehydrogenase (short-subunit alcohol dehydrogenase family)/acyl carrier protein
MMKKKELLILSPFEVPDVPLALDTIKAGAFPILHTGRNKEIARKSLEKLSQKTTEPFGICISATDTVKNLDLPPNVTKIILPYGMELPVDKHVEILYQVHSLKEAKEALAKKTSAIIIKGNEGAGQVADESSFIFFQKIIHESLKSNTKVYIQGGAGVHTSAAFLALGAQGIILDSQVALFPECGIPKELKTILGKLSGSETVLVDNFRIFHRSNSPKLPDNATGKDILPYLGGFDLSGNYLPMGQDVALSVDLVERYKYLKNLVPAIFEAAYGHLLQAKKLNIIAPGNELAKSLGTEYPVAQGPMARISDVPEFIRKVADEGALPFLALSMAKGESARDLLKKTSGLLEDKTWGVGMLGFVHPQLREEQTQYILETKPKVVLIAGGRPSLAKPFEKEGIKTFLHVPSPTLLDMFLKEGAKNFIFEGRESGGHVGPLSSMVLWEKQINRLLQEEDKSSISVFFAGGIHDAFSSAFVSVMAAPLAAREIKTGVLMGTSYLYTKEIVKTGAIKEEYQKQILEKDKTILLEAITGQETRSVKSPFTDFFAKEKQRLISEGMDSTDVWIKLEDLNIGRLRVAAKGIERRGNEKIEISREEQIQKGLYMTGEVTCLVDKVTTIPRLHTSVAVDNNTLLSGLEELPPPAAVSKPVDIAIVGMECIFPDARNVEEYWKNILLGKDCVTEVPDSRWNKELFYNPETRDTDFTVSKWGGYIPLTDFDPLEFGITPQSLASIEPVQLLSLLVAKRALEDAGYNDLSAIDLDNTSVIFGAEGAGELASTYGSRAGLKQLFGEMPEEAKNALPRLNEDSFAGVLSNVISGRITNRLNLGGRNYTVDAACASSLAALDIACHELSSNRSDMVILGGADLHNGICDFLMFSSTYALSRKGYCASFDSEADGITLGEGIGALILKRLDDAERDGNKIYAVIKGIGGSSDGRSLGLTAPNKKGQVKALQRAYQHAGILPSQVGMIEAHGTGTIVGDRVELSALTDVFIDSGALPGQTYLGSVKTQIGHTKCAAGVAGIIKAALSVYYGIIPPTLHLNKPTTYYKPQSSPFVFNTDKPGLWNTEKRMAGVSGFGFGGTNFHTIIENYQSNVPSTTSLNTWPSELFVFRGNTLQEAKEQMQKVKDLYLLNDTVRLKNVAYSLAVYTDKDIQVSIVASASGELLSKIEAACEGKREPGIYYRDAKEGKVAFLFSGQGSQRVNMARDLFVAFPGMRRLLNENKEYEKIIFPESVFTEEDKKEQQRIITDTRNAQPLLGMVDWAIAGYLRFLGIEPDMVAGHSYGELPALCFAGVFDSKNLPELSRKRAESILNAIQDDKGKMVAVNATEKELEELLKDETEVWAVNFNSTRQIVLAGTSPGIDAFMEKLNSNSIAHKEINVACAFHSPLLSKAKELYASVLENETFNSPGIQVWSNTTAEAYPPEVAKIKERLAEHLVNPVLFTRQVENMYAAGARVFIETGPGNVLTGLAQATLGNEITTIQTEHKGNDGITYLLKALAQYLATGRSFSIDKLFEGRNTSLILMDEPENYRKNATVWYINGHNAVPSDGKMPADGAFPIAQPLISLKDMMNQNNIKNNTDSGIGTERIMLEYLENMKSVIQDQRDVMLGYLGQPEIVPRASGQRAVPRIIEPEVKIEVVETVEAVETENRLPDILSLSTGEIKTIILEVVSEKTGYPVDMLGMDMDLEADLSIDSIKRMEIIGALRDRMNFPENPDESEDAIERLASIKTLNALIAWIEEIGKNVTEEIKSLPEGEKSTVAEDEPTEITRISFELEPYAIDASETLPIEGKRFALTDDGGESALAVKNLLETKGAFADIVKMTDSLTGYDGLILLNVSASPVNYTMKDLFRLVKSGGMENLKWIYTFSDIIGALYNTGETKDLKKIQGFPGFIKSLIYEYPDIHFRVVDSHTPFDKKSLAQIVVNELSAPEKFPEIIYKGTERFRFKTRLNDLPAEESPILALDNESVVMVLGGAQGITPELISRLAADYPCHYILVGRSQPDKENEEKYGSLKTKEEIRKYLIGEEGMKIPKEIEEKVQTIFKTNQVKISIQKIEEAGGKVSYRPVDVKNAKEFKTLLKETQKEYGKIDGIIHAAGVLNDQLFEKKVWKSFEQTYQTKVNPLNAIIDEALPELKFLVLFSSASSVFGNRGQCDYAAGNSVFDLTSFVLKEKKADVRVLSINWGPWKGAGMVSEAIENEFKKKGVAFIPLKEGSEFFVNELKYGKTPLVLAMGGKRSEVESLVNGEA